MWGYECNVYIRPNFYHFVDNYLLIASVWIKRFRQDSLYLQVEMRCDKPFVYNNDSLECQVCDYSSESLKAFTVHFQLHRNVANFDFPCAISSCTTKMLTFCSFQIDAKLHLLNVLWYFSFTKTLNIVLNCEETFWTNYDFHGLQRNQGTLDQL